MIFFYLGCPIKGVIVTDNMGNEVSMHLAEKKDHEEKLMMKAFGLPKLDAYTISDEYGKIVAWEPMSLKFFGKIVDESEYPKMTKEILLHCSKLTVEEVESLSTEDLAKYGDMIESMMMIGALASMSSYRLSPLLMAKDKTVDQIVVEVINLVELTTDGRKLTYQFIKDGDVDKYVDHFIAQVLLFDGNLYQTFKDQNYLDLLRKNRRAHAKKITEHATELLKLDSLLEELDETNRMIAVLNALYKTLPIKVSI